MADKELKKMSREELIEIIYALQKNEKMILNENEELNKKLNDRIIRLNEAGNIAEASLSLNGVFEAAQKAAAEYLESIKTLSDEKMSKQDYLKGARAEAERIKSDARSEADAILAESKAKAEKVDADSYTMATQRLAAAEKKIRKEMSDFYEEVYGLSYKYPELQEVLEKKGIIKRK